MEYAAFTVPKLGTTEQVQPDGRHGHSLTAPRTLRGCLPGRLPSKVLPDHDDIEAPKAYAMAVPRPWLNVAGTQYQLRRGA